MSKIPSNHMSVSPGLSLRVSPCRTDKDLGCVFLPYCLFISTILYVFKLPDVGLRTLNMDLFCMYIIYDLQRPK